MSVHTIGQWLRDYGVDEFDGACSFTYKGVIDFSLEVSTDDSHLVMHSIVGELPQNDDAALPKKLLGMNYLGIETRGATLSLDETGVNVVLWISLPIDALDIERFEQVIGAFLDLSEQMSALVRSG